jgi:catechol 2,3-dioxygenase-like lactoylglutathione lyase family enzyme
MSKYILGATLGALERRKVNIGSIFGIASFHLILLLPPVKAVAQAVEDNPLGLASDHATISVANLTTERDWYIRVLGFKETNHIERGSDFAISQMTIPGYRIDLVWQRGSSRSKRGPGDFEQGWRHIVFKTSIIDQDYKRLVAQQADVTAERDSKSTITRLLVHDPEGNEFEIFPN